MTRLKEKESLLIDQKNEAEAKLQEVSDKLNELRAKSNFDTEYEAKLSEFQRK